MFGFLRAQAAFGAHQAPARPSPDGTRLLVRLSEGTSTNLAVFDLSTRRTARLTFLKSGAIGNIGTWTPDSKHIIFGYTGTELNGPGVYWIRADGGGEPQRMIELYGMPWSFSPDGKRFAYHTGPSTGSDQFGLWTVPLNLDDPEHPKAGPPELYLKASATVQYPAFSPDGHWIAYASIETGRMQVYVRPFVPGSPATGGKWQISSGAGAVGFWLPNHELLFASQPSSGIVSYTTNPDSFVAGPVRPILEKSTVTPNGAVGLMPDGKRFVVVLQEAGDLGEQQSHVTFLLNFPDELERRVSAGTPK